MLDDLGQRSVRDEAQVSGAGCRLRRLRLELLAPLVQVNLLRPERQRLASLPEGDDLHPQHARIEGACRFDAADGQHEMVERNDSHDSAPGVERSDELAASVLSPQTPGST